MSELFPKNELITKMAIAINAAAPAICFRALKSVHSPPVLACANAGPAAAINVSATPNRLLRPAMACRTEA